MSISKINQMIRHITLLLLILWLAVLGCNQSDTYKDKTIYGLWEYRFSYNEFENDWEEVNSPLWALISEEFYKERFSQYSNTDSICYSDWTVIDNSSESRSWAIDGDDSATVHIYWDMEVVTTFKAYKDTLIINVSYGNIPVTREKAIKIDSFDFSPLCSD